VLQDGSTEGSDVFGPAAIRRLDADVLSQDGVTTVILLEGINDLSISPVATVDELIGGYRQLIERMHAHGLRVLLGTITPAGGAEGVPADAEAKRQAVNTWIRDKSPADAVVDFDAVVRDPADPTRIAPQYDGGDHLHFNLAGYQAMGDAIPLDQLRNPACS
jgi:lysophospholipase L1-like esterase